MRASIPLHPADADGIATAARALAAGRLVLHPTETLVSLTGDPACQGAVLAARRIKGYRHPRPFLCLVADTASARALTGTWSRTAELLAEAFWPGRLTLVLPVGPSAPAAVTDGGRIALRAASDPVSAALVRAVGRPVFSTSANVRGEPPASAVGQAAAALAGRPGGAAIALGLEAATSDPAAVPSTVVDVAVDPPRVLRKGALSVAHLSAVIPALVADDQLCVSRSA